MPREFPAPDPSGNPTPHWPKGTITLRFGIHPGVRRIGQQKLGTPAQRTHRKGAPDLARARREEAKPELARMATVQASTVTSTARSHRPRGGHVHDRSAQTAIWGVTDRVHAHPAIIRAGRTLTTFPAHQQ